MLYALQVGVVEQMGEDAQRQFLQALTKQVNTAGLVIFCMHTTRILGLGDLSLLNSLLM